MTKIVKNGITYSSSSDNKVTQTGTDNNADYEVVLSGTADNTSRTEGVRKSATLKYNPSTQVLSTTNIQASDTVTANGVPLPHKYSTTEKIVGYWVDGRPIYERVVVLPSTISISAGNTSAAGTWGVVQSGWNDEITPISFTFMSNGSSSDSNVWDHLTGQWYRSGKSIRACNIRSSAVSISSFIIQYFYGVP